MSETPTFDTGPLLESVAGMCDTEHLALETEAQKLAEQAYADGYAAGQVDAYVTITTDGKGSYDQHTLDLLAEARRRAGGAA
jgi:hypothetical protein